MFEVLKQTPATQETLKQASAAIKKTLVTQKQTAASAAVNKLASGQWKSSTMCSPLFAIPDCANYVKPKAPPAAATAPTTTPAPTVTSKTPTKKKSSPAKSSTTSSSSSK